MAEENDPKYNFAAKENEKLSEIPAPVLSAYSQSRAWKKALIRLIAAALVARVLFISLGAFFNGNLKESISGFTPLESYDTLPPIWESPECKPTIEWKGAKKTLVNPDEVNGLFYRVEGSSSRGSVTIRRDPLARGNIIVKNKILLSEDSLQEDVKVSIDITDQDFFIIVKTPSWDGPLPTKRCVRVDTEIVIPASVKYFKSFGVDVLNAWINVKDLSDIEFAYVNLKTTNGRIEIEKLKTANGEIGTANGRIGGEFLISENIEVKTINGPIDAKVDISPWTDNVNVVMKSLNGPIGVHVCNLMNKQTVDVSAKSTSGAISATIDDNFTGTFSASTLLGYSVVEGSKLHFSKNTQNAKIGYKGGNEESEASSVKLEAMTGSIELLFRKDCIH